MSKVERERERKKRATHETEVKQTNTKRILKKKKNKMQKLYQKYY